MIITCYSESMFSTVHPLTKFLPKHVTVQPVLFVGETKYSTANHELKPLLKRNRTFDWLIWLFSLIFRVAHEYNHVKYCESRLHLNLQRTAEAKKWDPSVPPTRRTRETWSMMNMGKTPLETVYILTYTSETASWKIQLKSQDMLNAGNPYRHRGIAHPYL